MFEKLDKIIENFFNNTVNSMTKISSNNQMISSVNGHSISVIGDKVTIDGKEIDLSKIKTSKNNSYTYQTKNNIKIKDGQTYKTKDIVGDLNLSGNNITVIVEGNIVGDVTGASQVTVKGDMIGDAY